MVLRGGVGALQVLRKARGSSIMCRTWYSNGITSSGGSTCRRSIQYCEVQELASGGLGARLLAAVRARPSAPPLSLQRCSPRLRGRRGVSPVSPLAARMEAGTAPETATEGVAPEPEALDPALLEKICQQASSGDFARAPDRTAPRSTPWTPRCPLHVVRAAAAPCSQIEFYFSDANLPKDKFLLKQMAMDDTYVASPAAPERVLPSRAARGSPPLRPPAPSARHTHACTAQAGSGQGYVKLSVIAGFKLIKKLSKVAI